MDDWVEVKVLFELGCCFVLVVLSEIFPPVYIMYTNWDLKKLSVILVSDFAIQRLGLIIHWLQCLPIICTL